MLTQNDLEKLNLKFYEIDLENKIFKILENKTDCKYNYTSEFLKITKLLKKLNIEFIEDEKKNIKF